MNHFSIQDIKLVRHLGLLIALIIGHVACAETTDWGVIAINSQPTTISFSNTDITKNFTDQYSFSLQSGTDASASVAVTFDPCAYGCGNPSLTYGVYDANGGLVGTVSEGSTTVMLTAGSYVFQVKGTGMGAGNTVSYSGTMTFYSGAMMGIYASAVPEPSDYLLMLAGTSVLALAVLRRRQKAGVVS